MDGRENYFSRDHRTGDSSKTSFPEKPTPEEKGTGYLYPIDNEVVDDLRRITMAYWWITHCFCPI